MMRALALISWLGPTRRSVPFMQNAQWMNFYMKVLSTHASGKGLKITLQLEAAPENGITPRKIDETKMALRELGLSDDVKAEW